MVECAGVRMGKEQARTQKLGSAEEQVVGLVI